jgi:hypothetical protein
MTTRCKDRVEDHKIMRMADLKQFMEADDNTVEDQHVSEYHLCFDWVEPNTFEDQPEGYHKYQISWGGPSEEIRYYYSKLSPANGSIGLPVKVEFWLLDWFDGASVELKGDDLAVAMWILCRESLE